MEQFAIDLRISIDSSISYKNQLLLSTNDEASSSSNNNEKSKSNNNNYRKSSKNDKKKNSDPSTSSSSSLLSTLNTPENHVINNTNNNNNTNFVTSITNSTTSVDSGAMCNTYITNMNTTIEGSNKHFVKIKSSKYYDPSLVAIQTPISTLYQTKSTLDTAVMTSTATTTTTTTTTTEFVNSAASSSSSFGAPNTNTTSASSSPLIKIDKDDSISCLVHDTLRWIELKQSELNRVEYKCDLASIELELSKLRIFKPEIQKFESNIEDLTLVLNNVGDSKSKDELYSRYYTLCRSFNTCQSNLDSLHEFTKLMQDELKYLNDLEDVEYKRDWSQPRKLKSNELIQHRMNVELSLRHKQQKNLSHLFDFASYLCQNDQNKHPASHEILTCVQMLKSELAWMQNCMMPILDEHIKHLENYEVYMNELDTLNSFTDLTNQKFQHFSHLLASRIQNKKLDSQYDDITNQFDFFKQEFLQTSLPDFKSKIERLDSLVSNELPSFKLRKMSISSPDQQRAEFLCDYSLLGGSTSFRKGELCKILDNSNQIKWQVISLESKQEALVPSVCFILKGPDQECLDLLNRVRFRFDQLYDDVQKFDFCIKREKIMQLMNNILKETRESSELGISLNRPLLEKLIQDVREEIESIIGSNQTINLFNKNNKIRGPVATSNNNQKSDYASLMNDFKQFDLSIKQVVNGVDKSKAEDSEQKSLPSDLSSNNKRLLSNFFKILFFT